MKRLPLVPITALVFALACGSSNNKFATLAVSTPAAGDLGTPVPTTRLGTRPPGATPRSTTTVSAGLPTVPAGTGDIVKTASGLQYQDIVVGTGVQAQAGQMLTVNYTGYLDDGTVFDSSLGRQPFSFPLGKGNVIKGWDEGLATMNVGGKRRLVIPPALGYGTQGQGKIPPNARLTFDVELLSAK